jgi:rhodanese-related sulfurtransferase
VKNTTTITAPAAKITRPEWAIPPTELAPGVRTIGELELIEHLERGLPAIGTRQPHFYREGTIPGARSIPHDEILDHLRELDRDRPTVFFCNGPQCAASPDAIRKLLDAGYPPRAILYYRGGMHDWITLGLPVGPSAQEPAPCAAAGAAGRADG